MDHNQATHHRICLHRYQDKRYFYGRNSRTFSPTGSPSSTRKMHTSCDINSIDHPPSLPSPGTSDLLSSAQPDIEDVMNNTPTTRSSPINWYCCYCNKHNGGWQGPYNVELHVTCFVCEQPRCGGCSTVVESV